MINPILDPTGRQGIAGDAIGPRLAPRPSSLRGARVALLDNGKRNAAIFLDEIGRRLEADHAATVVVRRKASSAHPIEDELLQELTDSCDVMVTAVGDCGSCSASAVADGLLFEAAGVPAAVVCTDAFHVSADAMARVRGADGYAYLTTAHPVAVLGEAEVRARAAALVADIEAGLVLAPPVQATA